MFTALRDDLTYALRHLQRSPGFAFGVTLTLALGVGLNAAIYSVLNAVALRALPIRDPQSLIAISPISALGQPTSTFVTVVDALGAKPIDDLCAFGSGSVGVEINGAAAPAAVELFTSHCFTTIGAQPAIGRAFAPDEAPTTRPGAKVVVISDRFWHRMFASAPDVIGKTFRAEGIPVTVIGVMHRGFDGLQVDTGVDIIAPFGTLFPTPPNRPATATHILGRLPQGVTLAAVRAEITARWPALMKSVVPSTLPLVGQRTFLDSTVRVQPAGTGFSGLRNRYAQPLWIVTAIATALLLIACLNIGGLLLSRLAVRASELAVRIALGGSRLRVTRQLVIELLIITAIATTVAFAVAWAAVIPLAAMLPYGNLETTIKMTPDARVFLATAAAGLVSGLLASVIPVAFWVGRFPAAMQWSRTVATANRPGRALLMAQVALSAALLISAGLLGRSLQLLLNNDPGFSGKNILTARLRPVPGAYADPAFKHGLLYYPLLMERIRALPGVTSVGYARAFGSVFDDQTGRMSIDFVGAAASGITAQLDIASPGFFETVGIPILRGRGPQWTDTPDSPRVAFVSDSLARALGGDVIGRHVAFGNDTAFQDVEIVGVVGNASLGNLRSTAPPVFYRPGIQVGAWGEYPIVVIAANGDLASLAAPLRETLRSLGREYVLNMATLDERVRRNAMNERVSAGLAIVAGVLAAVLAFVGSYSLFSYAVARRAREIGIRVAVGAAPAAVSQMVVRESIVLTAAGISVGIPAGIAASRWLRVLMFGVTESDPIVATTVAAFFLLLTIAAVFVPARRAARVDPVVALRAE